MPAFPPKVVAAARALLEEAKSLLEEIAGKHLDLGDVLNQLQFKDLYQAAAEPNQPYLSFRHFLRQEGLIPYSTAQKYMALARTYKSPGGRKLAIDKAVALLRLATWEGKDADDLAESDELIDGTPVSEHTTDSLEALLEANKRRKEELEALKEELASNPDLAEQHRDTRSTADKLERVMESTFAAPPTVVRPFRPKDSKELRLRIELSLEDAQELLALLRAQKDESEK